MSESLEPCCYSSNHDTQIVIDRCQKKHRASNEEESKLWSRLPEEMLIQVLIRLPSKNATIFKLVCKCWCTLISSAHFISNFISLHRQRYSSDTPKFFTLVFQHGVSAQYLNRPDHVNLVEVASESYTNNVVNLDFFPRFTPNYEEGVSDFIITYAEREPLLVTASCRDLMLCSRRSTYYVVNMLTRQWIVLPTCSQTNEEEIRKPYHFFVDHKPGILSYNDNKDKNGDGWYRFKVILVPKTPHYYSYEYLQNRNISRPDLCSSKYSIQIFCSETRQWTKVIVDWYPLNLNYCLGYSPILSFNRMLHWLVGSSLVSLDLFSGDPNLSLTHVIKLPDEFVIDQSLCFGLCMGHLRVAYQVIVEGCGRVRHIWELEDWSTVSWSLVHKFVPRQHKFKNVVKITAFHPYDRDIVFVPAMANLYLYNMQRENLTLCSKLQFGKDFYLGVPLHTVPPLLHPWFPTPVPSPPPA